ncbi:MAG: amidohydrolase family protein [Solirubrobacteraceae bacterium]
MLVDMHAHVIPGALDAVGTREDHRGPRVCACEDPRARLLETDRMQFKASDAFYSAQRRLEELERSGVDVEVVSPMPPLLDWSLPGDEGLELCRRVNEFIAQLTQTDANRLLGMGMVPMQAPELACAELERIRDAGLVAIEITSNVAGRSLHEDEFAEFWSEAERIGMPVFVHGMPGDLGGRVPAGLVAVAGFAVGADCALAATSIVAGGVAQRHPDLRLAFSHGAGGFPCMLGRANFFWGKTWNEEPSDEGEGESPMELARRFYYDGLVMDARTLRHLIEIVGHDRVLVGSDFPAMAREDPCACTLRTLELEPDQLHDITWNNAFRWLGVQAPVAAGAGTAIQGASR